jgi:oleate hydratase
MFSTARDRAKLPVPLFTKRWVEKTIIGRLLEEYGLV